MKGLNLTLLQCIAHLVQQHPDLSGKIEHLLRDNTDPRQHKFSDHKIQFQRMGGVISQESPILTDFDAQAGDAAGHYFHQDLLVASLISQSQPKRHIDIGSRIDGFVAHVASFREIEVVDIRELNLTAHQNIKFLRADLMNKNEIPNEVTDSLSCLHAIEHFGLGRYGDEIDPLGHHRGFENIVRMLTTGGRLYISFPIGIQNAVHFNAHRVFHPLDIFNWPSADLLILERFDCVDDAGNLHLNFKLNEYIPQLNYGCGIYTLRRI